MPPPEDNRLPGTREPGAADSRLPVAGDVETRSAWPDVTGDALSSFALTQTVASCTFLPNDLVAGRFRIVRYIARGGMGELYEAADLELHERVALKTIRSEIAEDERAIRRFKREVHLARQVTHPSVCRIFDVFFHRTSPDRDGRTREIVFITMELLSGETLAARIRRLGRLSVAEARPLVEQMAAALAAAHRAGVVHRDFKSSNVLLTPSREEGGGLRAVVTDFGLARHSRDEDSAVISLTNAGEISGTPAYMAPEQVEGGDITGAADIYALGVVMYEMVTGTFPFMGDTPLSVVVKRLHEPPRSPRLLVPELDAAWDATILRCLERHPGDRFGSATDVVKALAGETVAASPKERRRTRRWILAGVAAVALLGVGAAWLGTRLGRVDAPPPTAERIAVASVTPRRTVAVLGFKNLSGRAEAAWLSTALAEMLTTELAAGEKLRTIPGENVARMKIDLALADAESFAGDTLARIRANLGTDLVVLGSYVSLGDKLRLDIRLQDAAAGRTISAVADTGTTLELLDLVSRAGARLRDRLGVATLSASEATRVRQSLPANPEAARLYAEGLARLRLFDAQAARELLARAVAVDPTHPLAHAALGTAWTTLGYDQRAREQAEKAFQLSAKLSREERLWVEGRYRETLSEWDKAIELYRTLFNFFPDNLEYGLQLASTQTAAGKAKDALSTVQALGQLPVPAANDPRIDLAEAAASSALADLKQTQAAAARAAAKGSAQGARLLVARARLSEGRALTDLGEARKAIAACEEAQQLFDAAGDRAGTARAMIGIAVVLRQQGNLGDAKKLYEQALGTYREIGDKSGSATTLNNIANVRRQEGDMAGATRMYRESLAISREIADKSGAARALNNIAIALRQQGDLPGAQATYEEALAIRREIGEKDGVAATLNNIANVLSDRGDLAGSRKMYEEALATWREVGERRGVSMALNNLAFVRWRQDGPAEATKLYQESLQVARQMGDKRGVGRTLINLSDVRRSEGDLAGAKQMLDEALTLFREVGEKRSLGHVHAGLGTVLLAQGDLTEARKRHEEALAMRRQGGEKGAVAESRVALAELAVEAGRPADGEALARQAAEQFAADKRLDAEATAHAVVARSALAQGKLADAQRAVDRATALLGRIQNRFIRLSVATAEARVRAARGGVATAARSLEATLADAEKTGFVDQQLDVRLALGEIEMRSGRSAAGRARLEALEKDAASTGFVLIARKAAAARR